MVRINSVVAGLPATIPFVSPEEFERKSGVVFKARLGANEGNFGPSPKAVAAIARAATEDSWKYSDPTGHDLRADLARHVGHAMEGIVLGCGIDNLLGLSVRIFSETGDAVVTSNGAYPTFNYHVSGFDRRLVTVPYENNREPLDSLAEAVRKHNAPLVYLSNPDNPMGTWWDDADVVAFARTLPTSTLLLLDEAYGETAPPGCVPTIGSLPDNVIRLRTFSKAYGLAGMRCGYAMGDPALIAQYSKVRDHFGVTMLSQIAARAALADQPYLTLSLDRIGQARERIAATGRDNGLAPLASGTNFVALDTGRDAAFAMVLLERLRAERVFIRKPMAPGLDHFIRVSVGRTEELDWFAEALPRALDATKHACG